MSVTVSYTSIIADDIGALCSFYEQVLGLSRVDEPTDIFEGLVTGNGVTLAFSAPIVYELLGIESYREPTGSRQYVTFELDSDDAIDETTDRAVTLGAELLHAPYVTVYGAYQAVLADLEGNIVRLNHAGTSRGI